MHRKDFLRAPVKHIKIDRALTVNQLIEQFKDSGSFGAGRLSEACDIYERMVRDKDCTIFLTLAGAMVPAGLRSVVSDLIRKGLVDVVVSTGANMVHDAIEALGGHHYRGHYLVDDNQLYKYHIYRIYDVFAPEEDFVKLDYKMVDLFDEIADEYRNTNLSSSMFASELGKRLNDKGSILRAAYETHTPLFLPAVRDSEFGYIHFLHATRRAFKNTLVVDAFKDVPEIINICRRSPKTGMLVIGGGVPRNTVQSAALATKSGMEYAVVITMDRPETGGLSGSTLEETVSWGKVKAHADKVMVVGDAVTILPIIVVSVSERLGESYKRKQKKWPKLI